METNHLFYSSREKETRLKKLVIDNLFTEETEEATEKEPEKRLLY